MSRQTASKWWNRWLVEGDAGLEDRSSRPRRSRNKTGPSTEKRIVGLRTARKLGPARIGFIVGLPASTVHRVLVRRGLNRLAWMDRPTGRVIRRISPAARGSWSMSMRRSRRRSRPAAGTGCWAGPPAPGQWPTRAAATCSSTPPSTLTAAWLTARSSRPRTGPTASPSSAARTPGSPTSITVEALLTDSGPGYNSHAWAELCAQLGVDHRRIRAYRPPDQRQSRTVQPNHGRRVGLPPALPLRSRTLPPVRPLAARPQPSPRPHRPQRPTTHPSRQQLPGHYS